MISTVAGDSNAHMYAVLIKQQVDARQIQFMALSVSEHELRSVDLGKLAGHLAAWNTSSLSSRSKRRVHQNVMNTNHHLSKPAATGTFEVVWQCASPIKASVWSRYLPESARRTADWTFLWVCGGCAEPSFKDW